MRRTGSLAALVLATLLLPWTAFADSPSELQRRAAGRIDAFVDTFRKTGDRASRVGELGRAYQKLDAARRGFLAAGDKASAALCRIKMGDAVRMQDRWQEAQALYQDALETARAAGHAGYEAKAHMGLARVALYGLRQFGAAGEHVEEAVRLSAPLEDRSFAFDALDYRAQVQIARGDLTAAADSIEQAFRESPHLRDQGLLYYAHLDRGDVYQKLAEKCDYQRTFAPCYEALDLARADYGKALETAQKLGWAGLAGQTQGFLKELDLREELIRSQERSHKSLLEARLFHPKRADDVLVHERFLAGGQTLPPGFLALVQQAGGFTSAGDARSAYVEGLFHDMQGDRDAALASYLKSVERLEADRRALKDPEGRGGFFEDKIEFYYAPILHLLERKRYDEAFELLERSRSRALADLLASRDISVGSPAYQRLYAESLRLRAAIAQAQADLLDYRTRRDRPAEKIAKVEGEIAALEAESRALADRTAREAPRLGTLTASKPASLKSVQALAKKGGFDVLTYLVQESAVLVWHIGAKGVHVRSVFLPRSELQKKVAALRQSLAERGRVFDREASRELFLFLVQPALGWLETERLVVVPHEDLNYVPFQVFQDPASGQYLGERFAVSYAPSAGVLAGLPDAGAARGAKALALADPSIAEAPDEARTVAGLYGGESLAVADRLAKESEVKAWAGLYDVLHLSVHGTFDAGQPLSSHLKLTKDETDDGNLTAAEMFGLPLRPGSLVVLSACETGRGQATHANEVLGMTRALLYAGAGRLVLSFWEVNSASTAVWMKAFHEAARSRPVAEAARLALLAVKARPEYEHPRHWGAFLVVGR